MTTSAGILLYKIENSSYRFLLVHPGGPYFRKKDKGWWTIPKGEPEEGEELIETAKREMEEETGIVVSDPTPLGSIKQKGGKTVHAWAASGDWEPEEGLPENTFEIEWPPRSGKKQAFPEVDKAAWFTLDEAKDHINKAQIELLIRLVEKLSKSSD
ncbi:MAG: NUDIX domain-containing protein [Cyclobacteriaceae bacterium]